MGENKVLSANENLIRVTRAVCSVAVKPGLDLSDCYLRLPYVLLADKIPVC